MHRWLGLGIALLVLCVGATGALTAFQQEIDAWLNPDLLRVDPAGGATRSLDHLVAAAVAIRPGLVATGVRLALSRSDSVEVSVSSGSADAFAGWYVYVDPHGARVLGARPFDPDPWSRRGIVTALLGVCLAWPRPIRGWRRASGVRFSDGWARASRDLHRSAGLVAALFLVVVLASGILLNFAPQTAAFVGRFSPLTAEPTLRGRGTTMTSAPIGWQRAIEAARRAAPESAPFSVHSDAARRLYVVRMREPDAIHRRGQTRIFVDAGDATVLAAWNPRWGSAGDRLMSWQNPLHSGHAFGGTGRVVVFLIGWVAVLLVVTGVPRWYVQRKARSRR